MAATVPFSIASLGKTITAAGAIKVIDQQKHLGITLDSGIGPYLPVAFGANEDFKAIKFRELLTHTSGLSAPGFDEYDDLLSYISGHPKLGKKEYSYSNTNFALFRFLVPNILNGSPLKPNNPASSYAGVFIDYIDENVFGPIRLPHIPTSTDSRSGLDYHFPLPEDASYRGMDLGDLTLEIGSHGWTMSTRQLSLFLRELNYTEKILTGKLTEKMRTERLGYDNPSVLPNSPYTYCAKEGFYPGCYGDNAGEFWSELVLFGNGVSVALFVNSNLAYNTTKKDDCGYLYSNPLDAVVDAFNSTMAT